jgi:hypothetical protein
MKHPKIVLLVFVSGKIVLTGAKMREEIYTAFENIYPVLTEYRKRQCWDKALYRIAICATIAFVASNTNSFCINQQRVEFHQNVGLCSTQLKDLMPEFSKNSSTIRSSLWYGVIGTRELSQKKQGKKREIARKEKKTSEQRMLIIQYIWHSDLDD